MLKVSNKELLSLMKDKKVIPMMEVEDKKESAKEEAFKAALLVSLNNISRQLAKEPVTPDLSPIVSALQGIVSAQMKMCEMMKPQESVRKPWTFSIRRNEYGNITEIEAK